MTIEIKVDISGIDVAKEKLYQFKNVFVGEFIHRVRNRTPVDTGQLKSNWREKILPNSFILSNQTPYAYYVEYGTDVTPPRAMIGTTALEGNQIGAVAKRRVG